MSPFIIVGLTIVRDIACNTIAAPTIWTLDKNISHYNNRLDTTENASVVMPRLSELGDYDSVYFAYQHQVQSLLMRIIPFLCSLFMEITMNHKKN